MTHWVRDRGETLIEVLVAVAIIAVAFVVIVGGIGTAIVGSDVQQNQTVADSNLKSAAEAIRSDRYVLCATSASYSLGSVPAEVSISQIAFWNPATKNFDLTACPSPDPGMQLITLTDTPPAGEPHAAGVTTLEVVIGQS